MKDLPKYHETFTPVLDTLKIKRVIKKQGDGYKS